MASAATLGYQSAFAVPSAAPAHSDSQSSASTRTNGSTTSQYWSSNTPPQPSSSNNIHAGSRGESPTRARKKRKTLSQQGSNNSECSRTSRPRSLRRRNSSVAAMMQQQVMAPHHYAGRGENLTVPRHRRGQRQRRQPTATTSQHETPAMHFMHHSGTCLRGHMQQQQPPVTSTTHNVLPVAHNVMSTQNGHRFDLTRQIPSATAYHTVPAACNSIGTPYNYSLPQGVVTPVQPPIHWPNMAHNRLVPHMQMMHPHNVAAAANSHRAQRQPVQFHTAVEAASSLPMHRRPTPADVTAAVTEAYVAQSNLQNLPQPHQRYVRGSQRNYNLYPIQSLSAPPPQFYVNIWAVYGQPPVMGGGMYPDGRNFEFSIDVEEELRSSEMTRQQINQMPTYRCGSEAPDHVCPDQDSCVICMADYENKQLLRVMPCGHQYHVKCIDKWLKAHRNCPVCRKDVTGRPQPVAVPRPATETIRSQAGATNPTVEVAQQ